MEIPLYRTLKSKSYEELNILSSIIRKSILETVSNNNGHLASNLGTVDFTIALLRVFDPKDNIILWDTGHQSYTYKILTGRYESFETLRRKNGISGFPNIFESEFDHFGTGHSGTALAAGLGIEKALKITGENKNVIVVIGDGAMTSGICFEALNQISNLNSKIKIILNDNGMSISKNVGSLSKHLNELRVNKGYISLKKDMKKFLEDYEFNIIQNTLVKFKQNVKKALSLSNIFEDLKIKYYGPINGHNIKEIERNLESVKISDHPTILHLNTVKGRGIKYAEEDPTVFHSVSNINKLTGAKNKDIDAEYTSYSLVFGKTLERICNSRNDIVAISAAMPDGVGLKDFSKKFPNYFFDLGITEQFCTTFASALALKNIKSIFAVYSSFLQRGFDQLIHDVALQNSPVLFAIDRAGIVGEDGPTHNGVFDISYINMIPNFSLFAPSSPQELANMLYTILTRGFLNGPVAIRYPKEKEKITLNEIYENMKEIDIEKWELLNNGDGIALLITGPLSKKLISLAEEENVTLYNCRNIKPMDLKTLSHIFDNYRDIITVEEGIINGGFGSAVLTYGQKYKYNGNIHIVGIDDVFTSQGKRDEILSDLGIDMTGIKNNIHEIRGYTHVSND